MSGCYSSRRISHLCIISIAYTAHRRGTFPLPLTFVSGDLIPRIALIAPMAPTLDRTIDLYTEISHRICLVVMSMRLNAQRPTCWPSSSMPSLPRLRRGDYKFAPPPRSAAEVPSVAGRACQSAILACVGCCTTLPRLAEQAKADSLSLSQVTSLFLLGSRD